MEIRIYENEGHGTANLIGSKIDNLCAQLQEWELPINGIPGEGEDKILPHFAEIETALDALGISIEIKGWMNPSTGSVDTWENWEADQKANGWPEEDLDNLVEVEYSAKDGWECGLTSWDTPHHESWGVCSTCGRGGKEESL